MHLPDGLLPAPLCIGGYAATGLTAWYTLRQIERKGNSHEELPKAALLTAAFFVASSIYIPIPPASVHLVLNGLMGVILGYYAFPAILIGLFLQAVVFAHGGLTTLGINAVMMGIPALFAYRLFRMILAITNRWRGRTTLGIAAFLAGAIGLGISMLIFIALTLTTVPAGFDAATERTAVTGLSIAHLPLMVIEGIFTATLVLFLQRVKPEMLGRKTENNLKTERDIRQKQDASRL